MLYYGGKLRLSAFFEGVGMAVWLITCISLFMIMYIMCRRTGMRYYDSIPVCTAAFILLLYLMAYFGAMRYVCIPVVAVLAYCLCISAKKLSFRKEDAVGGVAFAVLCLITAFFIRDHVVKWWDDVNYWATDAKALYYLSGFTGKYGNVAPEFGDYPPAIQIAKWCALRLSPHIYKEGLAFVGYTLMNMIFMLPLMRVSDRAVGRLFADGSTTGGGNIKGRDTVRTVTGLFINIFWMIVIMLIPGIVNDVWSYGACADVTMGIAYGAMLLGIYEIVAERSSTSAYADRAPEKRDDNEKQSARTEFLPYIKVALYGAITALCKNTGFMWVTFAVILLIVLTAAEKIRDGRTAPAPAYAQAGVVRSRINTAHIIMTVFFIYMIQGSWWANCILRRRIAKLTGALAKTAAGGGIAMPEDAADKLRYYVLGFLKEPMHTSHTWALDISAFTMFALIAAAFVFLMLRASEQKRMARAALIYSLLTGLAIYIIVLLSHMSIFAAETQYGSSEVMAISISRYGAPFTIGTFMLLICMGADILAELHIGNRKQEKSTDNDTSDTVPAEGYDRSVIIWLAAIAVFIMLTTDYPAYAYLLNGYRGDRDVDLNARAGMIDPEGQEYIDYLDSLPKDEYDRIKGHRVLFLRDGSRIHWVNDTYISYEAAPIATVYASRDEGMSAGEIDEIIRSSHAEFVYTPEEGIRRVE